MAQPVPFSQETLQQLLRLAGLGILCWLLIRGRGKGFRRSEPAVVCKTLSYNSNANSRQSAFAGTQSLGAPPDVLKWQVELHDLGRELKGELDSKMIAVRALTKQYEQSAQRLGEMIRLAEQVRVPPESPLAIARSLADQGWELNKIASAISWPSEDVQQLLQSPK